MRISVIGSGFAGLVSAAILADKGMEVTLFEKNPWIGGRASSMEIDGYRFDKGPSWYWMPDVFDDAFERLGVRRSDYYQIIKLDPGFRVYFDAHDYMDIPADYQALKELFEATEKGAGENLDRFMDEAEKKYQIGVKEMARFPSLSVSEFINLKVLRSFLQMDLFKSVAAQVRSLFKNERLIKIMEFPVLFLGASAKRIPALYTMMNYAGLKQGTFYPDGGFEAVVKAFTDVAKQKGVEIKLNSEVTGFSYEGKRVSQIEINGDQKFDTDLIVGAGDYVHMESLLPKALRNYTENYWEKKTFAPSALLFYIGLDKKLDQVAHHSLFFHSNFEAHSIEIYDEAKWPTDPLFYVCRPSKTDPNVAPATCENLFILMPIAAGLNDSADLRQTYFTRLVDSFEELTGESINNNIVVQQSYCLDNFKDEYHAFKGNAYGLANTLKQTAVLKPSIKNLQLDNFYYAGQLTVPGPGVPPSIISGEIVADYILNKSTTRKSA